MDIFNHVARLREQKYITFFYNIYTEFASNPMIAILGAIVNLETWNRMNLKIQSRQNYLSPDIR